MKLSENFTYEELTNSSTAKRKGIDNTPNREHLENLAVLCRTILQPIRDDYGKPITVTSGYRSKELNKAVGGVSTSQHVYGEAADIICENNKTLWLHIVKLIEKGAITVGQLINEHNFSWIHISLPTKRLKNQIFCT